VDPLAEHDRFVATAAGRHPAAFLSRGSDGVLEVEALDRALASEAGLRALAGDVGAVGLQVEVDGLCHIDASVSFWSMRPRAHRARGVRPPNGPVQQFGKMAGR